MRSKSKKITLGLCLIVLTACLLCGCSGNPKNFTVGTMTITLTDNFKESKMSGFDAYFVDHTAGIYPTAASGSPWNAASIGVKGDLIADLTEDLAAEQKARVTYDNILRLSDDPDVNDVIKFLRAREIVHFQRFGEGLRLAKDRMNEKNIYFLNPSFDS